MIGLFQSSFEMVLEPSHDAPVIVGVVVLEDIGPICILLVEDPP